MPDPTRLNELQRQRALLQEHMAWLDREIAAEAGKTALPAPIASVVVTTAPGTPAAAPAPATWLSASPFAAAERIMAQYRMEPDSTKNDVRKGCLLYFALAFLVVILGVVALYFYSQSRH